MNKLCRFLMLVLCLSGGGAPAFAETREELDASVRETVQEFYRHSASGKELAARAAGMLVFPKVYKGGVGLGGEYGEGALLVGGRTTGYYSIAAGSIGLQLGLQKKSQVILFMHQPALQRFQRSKGWKAGVDGSVALATLGAGEQIDTETARKPIIGFIFSNKGLMYNLTFEGAKITRIKK
ncbi:MAG: YSC84-related protein [Steroidobacteraceae bacterium]